MSLILANLYTVVLSYTFCILHISQSLVVLKIPKAQLQILLQPEMKARQPFFN